MHMVGLLGAMLYFQMPFAHFYIIKRYFYTFLIVVQFMILLYNF